MRGPLAKYVSRSPRYILQTQDNTLIRLAGPKQVPWEESTEIQNISMTGLAFTAPTDLCPLLGEIIKIQFDTLGSGSMACLALVVRVQSISSSVTRIGIKFLKLDSAQRLILSTTLADRLKNPSHNSETSDNLIDLSKRRSKNFLVSFFFGVCWLVAIYYFWFKS